MTIESAILSIHEAGFRVLNLFELRDGTWQANVYDAAKAWEFGTAGDPEGALIEALRKTVGGKNSSFIKGKTAPDTFIKGKTAPDTILDNLF